MKFDRSIRQLLKNRMAQKLKRWRTRVLVIKKGIGTMDGLANLNHTIKRREGTIGGSLHTNIATDHLVFKVTKANVVDDGFGFMKSRIFIRVADTSFDPVTVFFKQFAGGFNAFDAGGCARRGTAKTSP